MNNALAISESVRVYRVAMAAGKGHHVAMRAARLATESLVHGDTSVGGFEVWKGIKTPGQIRDEINRIDGEVKSTGSDLATIEAAHAHTAAGDEITKFMDVVWDPFIASWTKFWAGHQGWTDNMWGTTWDQAQSFQKQLIAIRSKAKNLGLSLRSADPVTPDKNAFEQIVQALWSLIKIVIYVGVIIGGVILLRRY